MEVAVKVPKSYDRIEKNNDGPKRGSAKHRMNWVNATKGKEKATCPSTMPAVDRNDAPRSRGDEDRAGKRIQYDGEKGKITNVAEANQYLHREYRKGWTL